MGEHFPVREFWVHWKVMEFTQNTGKIKDFDTKCWKIWAIFFRDLNFRQFLFLSVNLIQLYFKTKKILENGKIILEKSGENQGNLSARRCGNHAFVTVKTCFIVVHMTKWSANFKALVSNFLKRGLLQFLIVYQIINIIHSWLHFLHLVGAL